MSAAEVLIGVYGWQGRDWCEDFFPDDLPEDWRVGYCANTVRLMVVPEDQVRVSGCAALEQWMEAGEEGLILLVEGGAAHLEACEGIDFSGFSSLEGVVRQDEVIPWTWRALNPAQGSPSLLALSCVDELPSPAVMRQAVDQIVAAAPDGETIGLVFDGVAAMAAADQGRLLVEMMGL